MKRELRLEIAIDIYHNLRREYILQKEFIEKRIKDCDNILDDLNVNENDL